MPRSPRAHCALKLSLRTTDLHWEPTLWASRHLHLDNSKFPCLGRCFPRTTCLSGCVPHSPWCPQPCGPLAPRQSRSGGLSPPLRPHLWSHPAAPPFLTAHRPSIPSVPSRISRPHPCQRCASQHRLWLMLLQQPPHSPLLSACCQSDPAAMPSPLDHLGPERSSAFHCTHDGS